MKNTLVKGTLILTITGLLTRVLGFYYRICLADALGAEFLGIYQLIFPVYGVCYTLYASGIQTAVSKLIAEENSSLLKKETNGGLAKQLLFRAIVLSVTIALALTLLITYCAEPIAAHLLMEPRAEQPLRVMALVFPFCAVTACINGFYYGQKKTVVPAFTQLLEQCIRILLVLYLVTLPTFSSPENRCLAAVIGLVLGEIASNLFNCISFYGSRKKQKKKSRPVKKPEKGIKEKGVTSRLIFFFVPLSLNRLVINLLHSVEAVLVPFMLRKSGLTGASALSLYGILNGMALPFILFPSAIPNALAVLLLPTVSESVAGSHKKRLKLCIAAALKYSMIVGMPSAALFLHFGGEIGTTVFHNAAAGEFLCILSFLCPMLYLSTTLSSIMNGLGKPILTFLTSSSGLCLRIGFILFLVPKTGIYGYLLGLLFSQLVITLADAYFVIRYAGGLPPILSWLVQPAAFAFALAFLFKKLYQFLIKETQLPATPVLFSLCGGFCVLYLVLLWLTGNIKREELRL